MKLGSPRPFAVAGSGSDVGHEANNVRRGSLLPLDRLLSGAGFGSLSGAEEKRTSV
jgi:hypothetical protein